MGWYDVIHVLVAEWHIKNFQKISVLRKLRLPFNFNFEGDKELCDQYDFSSHDETTNNNEPTHFKKKESHVVSVF